MELDTTRFRINLRSLLDSHGMTNKDLSDQVGFSAATVSRILTGKRVPDLITIVRIAEYFHVSIDWLLSLSYEQTSTVPEDLQHICTLYTRADPNDQLVINTVLRKYEKRD